MPYGQVLQRLAAAKTEQDEVAIQLNLPPPADQGPEQAEARRWELETRYEALSAEIKMLDQEPLSQTARVDLLAAKRAKAEAMNTDAPLRISIEEHLRGGHGDEEHV